MNPQNPNPRSVHGGDKDENEPDMTIKNFNERFFQVWETVPNEQKAKFIQLAHKMKVNQDFDQKYASNSDTQNRHIAFNKMFDDVMGKQRKSELDLYRLLSPE